MAGWHASVTLTPPDRYSPRWRGGEIFQTAARRGIPLPPSRKTSTTRQTLFATLIQLSLQVAFDPSEIDRRAFPIPIRQRSIDHRFTQTFLLILDRR